MFREMLLVMLSSDALIVTKHTTEGPSVLLMAHHVFDVFLRVCCLIFTQRAGDDLLTQHLLLQENVRGLVF